MNFSILKPDELILFPNSWEKYPKRAAAEEENSLVVRAAFSE